MIVSWSVRNETQLALIVVSRNVGCLFQAKESKMLSKCSACGAIVIAGGIHVNGHVFCSQACHEFGEHPGFCSSCLEQTLLDCPSSVGTLNGIGTGWYFNYAPCPVCKSVIRRLCVCILFLPVWRLNTYRVIHFGTYFGNYIARKVKPEFLTSCTSPPDASNEMSVLQPSATFESESE